MEMASWRVVVRTLDVTVVRIIFNFDGKGSFDVAGAETRSDALNK
jgi:hypothetical protein